MSKRFIYTCDHCQAERDEADLLDMEMWLHLDCSFITPSEEVIETVKSNKKTKKAPEPIVEDNLKGDFCTLDCLSKFLKSPKKVQNKSSDAVLELEKSASHISTHMLDSDS